MASRPLFGGSITCTLPASVIDASTLRQVPDTQEVFVLPDSDLSVIFEILEAVQPRELVDAIRFHFDSAAHDNEATLSEVEQVESLADTAFSGEGGTLVQRAILRGKQKVSKFNRPDSEGDIVTIWLALWRIPSRNVDLVATVNDPSTSRAAEAVAEGAENVFLQLQSTLDVRDYGLFAG